MLGLLLARAGVAVTVMEKHADFLGDFRGDTIHASTRRLLEELGLGEQFARLPHQDIESVRGPVRGNSAGVEPRRGPRRRIAKVSQRDFLQLLATAAAAEPTFRLLRSTEVMGPLRQGGRVVGVRYRGPDGTTRELRADLTVACDGRWSTLRSAMGLTPRSFRVPMDLWLFQLPRYPDDPPELSGMSHIGQRCTTTNRGDYYRIGFRIPKGQDANLRAQGIEALQRDVASLVPSLADRVGELTSFEDVKLLDVQVNRLRKWYADGILFIGDAAHAMSPAGGIGVNLAIADAVAAARILAGPLRDGRLSTRHLARVQIRRVIPAVMVQTVQRILHARTDAALRSGETTGRRPPRLMMTVSQSAPVRAIFGYVIGVGPFSEHAPTFARR
ncbi:FAD-dependent oxidoreductase [Mycobacterium malmoense]|nr:FAD-dependent oxidoreductase [Mycobacterium malmoense]UNB97012.1 FAD-dependent oxidoreductase [Mycobacterium malmoense]